MTELVVLKVPKNFNFEDLKAKLALHTELDYFIQSINRAESHPCYYFVYIYRKK